MLQAGDVLADRFDSWESVGRNYLAGRMLWLEDHGQIDDPSQVRFTDIADQLVSDPESPWNRVDWNRSGGVIVDGEPLG